MLRNFLFKAMTAFKSFHLNRQTSIGKLMSVWSTYYLRVLVQVGIALSTNTLVRKGEEPLEHLEWS